MSPRTDLTIVRTPSRTSERVAQLQQAAKEAASQHTHEMLDAFAEAERLAREVAEGGNVYPHGIREVARRTAEALNNATTTIWKIGQGT